MNRLQTKLIIRLDLEEERLDDAVNSWLCKVDAKIISIKYGCHHDPNNGCNVFSAFIVYDTRASGGC